MATEKSGHVIACTIAIDAEGDVIAYRLQHDTDLTTADIVAVLDQVASMIEAEDDETSH